MEIEQVCYLLGEGVGFYARLLPVVGLLMFAAWLIRGDNSR